VAYPWDESTGKVLLLDCRRWFFTGRGASRLPRHPISSFIKTCLPDTLWTPHFPQIKKNVSIWLSENRLIKSLQPPLPKGGEKVPPFEKGDERGLDRFFTPAKLYQKKIFTVDFIGEDLLKLCAIMGKGNRHESNIRKGFDHLSGALILLVGTLLGSLRPGKPQTSTERDAKVEKFLKENRGNGMTGMSPTKTARRCIT